jgi:hypothetical protein
MSLSSYSYPAKCCWRFLPIRLKAFKRIVPLPCTLNYFGVFLDYDKTFLAYSQNMLKELKLRRNRLANLTMPENSTGTVFRENITGDYIMAQKEQLTRFLFQ